MSARTINNPGVEIQEIDRSSYQKVDNSLPNSPTSLVIGFADQGQDMTIEWIDSKATLDNTFGTPTTEFESYMYNAAIEILNRGGTCIASKLPYDNESFQKYNYIDFDVSQLVNARNILSANTKYDTIGNIHDSLQQVLDQLGIKYANIENVNNMASTIIWLNNEYLSNDVDHIQRVQDLSSLLVSFINQYDTGDNGFSYLYFNDSNLTSYLKIVAKPIKDHPNEYGGKDSIEKLDDMIILRQHAPLNSIRVYDMTRAQYQTVENYDCVSCEQCSAWTNECLGIVPIIVTPANAMFFQNLLNFSASKLNNTAIDYSIYNSVSSFATMFHNGIYQKFENSISSNVSIPLASTTPFDGSPIDVDSVSRKAAQQFPPINFYDTNHFDKTNLKKIGVVVFKAFKDTSNSGKIGFQLVESFVGSLERNAKDQITKSSIFLDDVVNSSSQYIRLFSNVDQNLVRQATTYAISLQPAISMGFYKVDCSKNISYVDSVINPLTTVLEKASNRNIVPIDILVDGGMSNIAQLAKTMQNWTLSTDLSTEIGDYDWPFDIQSNDITGWKAVLQKFNNFCKSVRKDCIFIADGLRPVCLDGNSKIVRPTAQANTVANSVIPKFKYIAHAIDSSYAAGYCNWFLQEDYGRNGDYIWIPPSIKAAGVYIYCDTYFHPWSAPAGTVRGIIGDAVDVAFMPMDADAGVIYSNSWNYAMSYPIYGIVIEGHKTFQTQRTALDRVNVRRLMLDLEKKVETVARTFVYEQNTPYMRQQFVDRVETILEDAVSGGGISSYAIKCDEELNTPQVIDNNEMRCKIAVKPIKVVDYLVITFICTNQSVDVTEEVMR